MDDDVRRTAKFNNSTYPAEIFENKNEIEANKELFAGKATLFDLFRPMTICIRTIVMFYNWLVIIIFSLIIWYMVQCPDDRQSALGVEIFEFSNPQDLREINF